jgi:DNA mismatch repair protein MutL
MTAEDALASLQRHATSKIRTAGDLLKVESLGFRGEAVPSIASVSRMTISTGAGDGGRTVIGVRFGQVESTATQPGPRGTTIEVGDLFGNTPARLKFLKSDTSETSAIVDVVSKYATAHPEVAFTLSFGSQQSISTPGSGDLLDSLAQIWGTDFARALAEVDLVTNGIRVTGFVAPPHINKPARTHQLFFVNGRPIRSKTLFASVDAAYRSLTPERRYSAVALQISIDPADIDINVSPTKNEIKFHREGATFDAERLCVKSGLMEHGLMPSAAEAFTTVASGGMGMSHLPEAPMEAVADLFREIQAPITDAADRFPFKDLMEDLQVLGQVMRTFIVISTKRGIGIVDQHVAHERVLYEYLCGLRGGGPVEMQALLSPEPLDLDKSLATALGERLDDLRAVGFDVLPFGPQSFIVRAVPAAARGKDHMAILREVSAQIANSEGRVLPETLREKIWITTACRMAVKAGDPRSLAEMERLIQDLATTENPYLCPHGRPITITLTAEELLRRFKRT